MKKARSQNKPLLLEFYASWCVTCQELDRNVFSDTDVQKALRGYVLVRADITEHNARIRKLMARYTIVAPPALLFFDSKGIRNTQATRIGKVDKEHFIDLANFIKSPHE